MEDWANGCFLPVGYRLRLSHNSKARRYLWSEANLQVRPLHASRFFDWNLLPSDAKFHHPIRTLARIRHEHHCSILRRLLVQYRDVAQVTSAACEYNLVSQRVLCLLFRLSLLHVLVKELDLPVNSKHCLDHPWHPIPLLYA